MTSILLKNGEVINEGKRWIADILIKGDRIAKIDASISTTNVNEIIDLSGKLVLPGCIDDQVHFREP